MKRLWPSSLVGQMAGLTLLALVLSQGIGLLTYWMERSSALRGVVKEEFVGRTASIVQVLEATPPVLHDQILHAVGTPYTRYWVATTEPGEATAWQQIAWQRLASPSPPGPPAGQKSIAPKEASSSPSPISVASAAPIPASWEKIPASASALARSAKILHLDEVNGLGLAVRLADGTWLNAFYAKPITMGWSPQSYISMGIMAVALSLIAVITARRIARPLRRLAQAAEHLGRGEEVAPLPEEGPEDIRHTAEAFNRMQSRLRNFIEDRTRMLAAVGHDLRTPITALRLHAEFVADPVAREKMLATLDEMQATTEAALNFARDEVTSKTTRTVDLAALLESLCDDLADLGWDVTFSGGAKTPYRCRPDACRRAFRNLIENAVRYGERARVSLIQAEGGLHIAVDDDGPGIPQSEFERVFAPFVRLEQSRNRGTGGVGLGLSIARNIIRGHGGDILLANRPGGGLRVTVRLPAG